MWKISSATKRTQYVISRHSSTIISYTPISRSAMALNISLYFPEAINDTNVCPVQEWVSETFTIE